MYAITHAATALLLKRRFTQAALWPLLIGAQAIEILWVIFVYLGVEHVRYTPDALHLDFLPYSHSIASTLAVAVVAWVFTRQRGGVFALTVALAVVSHIILDLIHHEPDIALLPLPWGPRFGLGLATWPAADFAVELIYGLVCWYLFRGRGPLLAAIVIFNLLDIPVKFLRPGMAAILAAHPKLLPTFILFQIVITWCAVWFFARPREERAT